MEPPKRETKVKSTLATLAILLGAAIALMVLTFTSPFPHFPALAQAASLVVSWHTIGTILLVATIYLVYKGRRAGYILALIVSVYEGIIPYGISGLPSIASGQTPPALAPLFIIGLLSGLALLYFSATGLRAKPTSPSSSPR